MYNLSKQLHFQYIKNVMTLTLVSIISCLTHVLSGQSYQTLERMVSKIQTQTDPYFIYEYQQTKFVPPEDKTLLIMGQTVEDIESYLNHFGSQPLPGGWAAYWGIPEFNGVQKAHKNETGSTQNHQMLVKNFPNTVIQSALWMVGKWNIAQKTAKGHYDDVILKYSAWAKKARRPIYLRIGYEFDGIHNALEPDEYVKAYRHIVDLMRAEGVDNVAFVWHSYAAQPYNDYPISAWYPGDDYVDWVAISVFGHAYAGTDFGPHCDKVLEFAKTHQKPVMIAESSPIQGIDPEKSDAWNQWFVNFFSFIYQKNIKAVSFISTNWTKAAIDGISDWKDSRLQNNAQISKAWFTETNNSKYLKQSPDLYKQLDFKR